MNRRVATLGTALVLVAVPACGDDGPGPVAANDSTTVPSASTAPSTDAPPASTAPVTTALADGDPTAPRPLLDNADGANDALRGVAQIDGLGSTCTGFLVDAGAADGPAYALTNGHCVNLFDATTVLVDEPAPDGAVARFGLFADSPDVVVEVPVATVAYGSMRATDVAILELDATRDELEGEGLTSYSLAAPPSDGGEIDVVGVPVTGIDPTEWFLRGGTCTTAGTSRLVEWEWLWDAAVANDCAGILGGNSGSPVFSDGARDTVVGIINTTTIGSGPGACYLGQPCEIADAGATEQTDTSYFMPVGDWAACWTPELDLAGDDCPAETGPRVTVDAPLRATRSGATWAATIGVIDGDDDAVAVKTGPVASTDCRDEDGYGDAVAVPADGLSFDEPLPSDEGVVVLCAAVVGDAGPLPATAGYAVMEVDDTSPDAPITLSIVDLGEDVSVEPVFSPPEHSGYSVKSGPAASTDCSVTDDYVIYRRVAILVEAADRPGRLCVIGEDEAGNRGQPQSFDLG